MSMLKTRLKMFALIKINEEYNVEGQKKIRKINRK